MARGLTPRPAAVLAEVEPAEWDELLERLGCADVYLQRAYVESARLLEPGRLAFLHHSASGGDVVFCCIVREIPAAAGAHDVTTPYGYGGPVAVGRDAPVQGFWNLYEGWCAASDVVSTFIRFHPLFGNHRQAAGRIHLEPLAGTISWRLRPDVDLFASMHRHHQRVIRKAEAAGVSVTARSAPPALDDFAELYEHTMRRRRAEGFYFFPASYWRALSALGDRIVRFDAHLSDELVASCLCFVTAPWLHYHLGATLDRARSLGASNLLMYEAARWGQARGCEEFHLGGGVGGREDSLHTFKRRFYPPGHRDSWVGKAVHDRERYLALANSDELPFDGFFPAYRRPPA